MRRRQAICHVVYTSVYSIVRFEWDEAKSDSNLEERGFDSDGLHLTIVHTDRQSARGQVTRRIIPARRSSRHERKIYQKANP
jgi:uncharacterized DUF497 family protein